MALTLTTGELTGQTVASFIQRIYRPELESIVFRNDRFLGLFGRMPSRGDRAHRWPVHTAGNTSAERYVENQALPIAGSQVYTHASLDYENFRGVVKITGDVKAALKSDEARIFAAIEEEMTRIRDDVIDVVTVRMLGAAGPGLDLAVDSTGTYAGISRATTTAWGSQEDVLGGALTVAAVDQLWRELLDAERGAKPSLHITTPTLLGRYQALQGTGGRPAVQINVSPGQLSAIDLGSNWDATRHNGALVVGMPDAIAGVWYTLQSDKFEWIDHEDWKVVELGREDDADRFQVSKRGVLVDLNPLKQGKFTGAT